MFIFKPLYYLHQIHWPRNILDTAVLFLVRKEKTKQKFPLFQRSTLPFGSWQVMSWNSFLIEDSLFGSLGQVWTSKWIYHGVISSSELRGKAIGKLWGPKATKKLLKGGRSGEPSYAAMARKPGCRKSIKQHSPLETSLQSEMPRRRQNVTVELPRERSNEHTACFPQGFP